MFFKFLLVFISYNQFQKTWNTVKYNFQLYNKITFSLQQYQLKIFNFV